MVSTGLSPFELTILGIAMATESCPTVSDLTPASPGTLVDAVTIPYLSGEEREVLRAKS